MRLQFYGVFTIYHLLDPRGVGKTSQDKLKRVKVSKKQCFYSTFNAFGIEKQTK